MDTKKQANNFKITDGVNTYRFILRNIKKESEGKFLTNKEQEKMIGKIIKKAQDNKINDEEGNQISRDEFELIPWECWPGKDFGMPKVICNLIKILTGINLYEKEKSINLKIEYISYYGSDLTAAKEDFETMCKEYNFDCEKILLESAKISSLEEK